MFEEYICGITGLPCCGCSACCEHRKENRKMEPSHLSNYEVLLTLKPKEFAKLFVKLRLDSANENDWLEWMDTPCNKKEWEKILTN